MSDAADLFREWRDADRTAHDLEQLIAKQALGSLDGGPEPSEADKESAHRLREKANDLFRLAMAEMTAASDRNKLA